MKKIRLFLLAMLTLLSVSSRAEQEIQKEIFDQLVSTKQLLSPALTADERLVTDSIWFNVPNSLTMTHVGAYEEDGRNVISFNVGMNVRLRELAMAIALAREFDTDFSYLEGYIRYLTYAERFGGKFIDASSFASINDNSLQVRTGKSITPDLAKAANNTFVSMLTFVVAHELAHHVLGHTQDDDATPSHKRKQEIDADSWAMKKCMKAGFNPQAFTFALLLFNEAYERKNETNEYSMHPAPIERALLLLDGTDQIASSAEFAHPSLTPAANEIYRQQLLASSSFVRKLVLDRKKRQAYLAGNRQLLLVEAGRGNRYAQIKVGELFSTGKNPEFPVDLKLARTWYTAAADNSAKYDYFDRADAEYRLGWMYAFMPKVGLDMTLACKYLKRSADKDFDGGVFGYDRLKKEKKCAST
jgi:hypothetical protein